MKKFVISAFFVLIYFVTFSYVEATGSVSLSASKSTVNVGDTFTVSVNLSGTSVATLTARLSIDTEKIQYVSGPSNSNYSNGRVIYTWTDSTGGESPLTGGTIATFTFTAKSAGSANFGISGDFFTPSEISANPTFSGVSVSVNNVENNSTGGGQTGGTTGGQTGGTTGGQTGGTTGGQTGGTTGGTTGGQTGGTTGSQTGGTTGGQTGGTTGSPTGGTTGSQTGGTTGGQTGGTIGNQTINTQNNTNQATNISNNPKTSSNTNLKTLQLNVEGISPNFSPKNTQYYITIPENIENIEVTAEPEDSKSTIQIVGNTNIPVGVSQIIISIMAENGEKKAYTINVSKTNNIELANANLENLAIENATLNPEFNPETVDYTVEVFGDMDKLNILAIPQNENAQVTIEGNENLQYGENLIKITVVAEDSASSKIYNVIVMKNEEINIAESEDEQSEKEDVDNIVNRVDNAIEKNVKKEKVIIVLFVIILGIGVIIWFILRRKRNREKESKQK